MRRVDDDGNVYDDGQPDPGSTSVPYAPPPGTPGVTGNGGAPPDYNDTGAPQPGWSQDADGKWTFNDSTQTDPQPSPDPGTGGGGGGGGTAAAGQFTYPDWVPPTEDWKTFTPPTPTVTGPFSYADFQGPTAENFTADPGYDFRMKSMTDALKNTKSAQGLLGTGGTLTDIMNYAGGLASQEFGNVWNRDKTTYDTNRNNAFTTFQANEGLDNDTYTHDLTSYLTGEQAKADDWTRSLTGYTTNLNKYLGIGGLNTTATNNQFGNLLSLYGLMTKNMPAYTPTAA